MLDYINVNSIYFIKFYLIFFMLNRHDVNGKVRSRDDYWRAMVLNGYYMPSEKS